jgi:hypothetical protein
MGAELFFILAIIGFCSFFVWKWIFKKLMEEPSKINLATWVSTIVATPLIYLGIKILFIYSMFYYQEKKFSSTRWHSDAENRFELSKNLIDSNLLIGKTKKQVEQILGKMENFKADEWVYGLGFVPSPGNIDPDILIVIFKNGRVIKVSQSNS